MAASERALAVAVREAAQRDPYELLAGLERGSCTHAPRLNRRAFVAALHASPPPQVRFSPPPQVTWG
jgi:hypothetical protein